MAARAEPRRAELLAALSLAVDLGLGQPTEHMLRSAVIATRLAERLDLDDDRRVTAYYSSLVMWIGCHADSHEYAEWFGDDISVRRDSYELDWSGLPYLIFLVRRIGRGRAPLDRAQTLTRTLVDARGRLAKLIHSHCTSAGLLATHIGLGEDVRDAITYTFERWDGGGLPDGVGGEAIPVAMRVAQLADVAEVHWREGGVAAATTMARSRSGRQFDPEVVAAFEGSADELFRGLTDTDAWQLAMERAPDRDWVLTPAAMDVLLRAMGDFVDLKCPFTMGHSRGVAALAARAAEGSGLPDAQVATLRRAGYVHDLGRIGVSNQIWEKSLPLTMTEWERVRLHPYLSRRILEKVSGLEAEAGLAETHHERQDGSGYPRGVNGAALGISDRLLAAAESYQSSTEPRPHRSALDAAGAAARLQREAKSGRLDAQAVDAVLEAAGHHRPRRGAWPDGLTNREVEVLRLVAQAHSNREIAATLTISEKTVRKHVEHVYTKIGASNRTGASLYATQHGLSGPLPDPTDGASR